MFTQLETNIDIGFIKLTNHRSRANNTVSALIQIAETSPGAARIWSHVENDFVRLAESPTRDIRVLTPHEALKAARELECRRIKDVAVSYSRHENDINRYRGILGASLVLILKQKGLISQSPQTINQPKYQQLKKLHEEASAIAFVVTQPQAAEQLAQMPDLKALLLSFQQYSTVRLFLEKNGVPYTPGSIASFNADLRDYLFGNKTSRMGLFLRRATLSRWISNHTNWHGSAECEIDEAISRSAAFISSRKFPAGAENKGRRIRWFLNKLIAQELALAQKDITLSHLYSLDEIFVPANGAPIKNVGDINIPATFDLFADASACPEVTKSVVLKWLGSTDPPKTYRGLALAIYRDSSFRADTKKRWIEGGFNFLENVLLMKPGEAPSWASLSIGRRGMLRRFRRLFQEILSDKFLDQ